MAINSLVVATSSVAGPSVAAAILSVASWPWLFAINVPLGLVTFALGMRQTLQELTRAAGSVRVLTDYLERHPESLLRGKPDDNKK